MGDLLPCPFCGGEAFRRPTMRQFGNPAECRECGAVGPDPLIPVSWNTRHALPAAPAEDVRAGARIIPMHTESLYGVCIGGRWDGWVMVKHPDGYWVSHNKPDPIDPAATFDLIPEAKT